MKKQHRIAVLLPAAALAASPALAGTATFREGLANDFTGVYAGTRDATVLAPSNPVSPISDNNFGISTGLAMRNSGGSRYRSLLSFDLSALQGLGITVSDASLTLYKGASPGTDTTTNFNFIVGALASPNAGWLEGSKTGALADAGEVTGNNRAAGGPGGSPAPLPWLNAAGATTTLIGTAATTLFAGPSFTYVDDAALTPYVLTDPSLANAAQSWINTPAENAGLMVSNGGGSAQITVTSSEYTANSATRPTLTLTLSSPTTAAEWSADRDDTWTPAANWTGGTPNSVGAAATFGGSISAPRTVTVDADQIASSLSFNSPHAYTLSGAGTIRLLEVNVGQASLDVAAGSHTIASPLLVSTNTTASVAAAAELTLGGPVSGVQRTLTKAGAGTLTLSAANPLSGTVALNEGTLRVAHPEALKAATVTLAPAGALAFAPSATPVTLAGVIGTGALALSATDGSPLALVLDANSAPSFSGNITGAGSLTKTGTGTQTLSGTNAWTGGTTISAGTLRVTTDALTGDVSNNSTLAFFQSGDGTFTARVTGTGSIAKAGNGTVTFQHPLPGGNVSITAGALALAPDSGTSRIATLTATATVAKLDAANNPLVLSNTTQANLLNALAAARNGGAWDGTKGLSSSAAAADPTGTTAIAWATAADLGVTEWFGVTGLTGTEILTRVTSTGDLNLDATVNGDDYALLDRHVATHGLGAAATWLQGDVNYSGSVDSSDYLLIDRAFAKQSGLTLAPEFLAARAAQFGDAYVASLLTSIPEPATLSLITLAGLPLASRRRRRHHTS
jgi:autotransporter-associated beta strand protein